MKKTILCLCISMTTLCSGSSDASHNKYIELEDLRNEYVIKIGPSVFFINLDLVLAARKGDTQQCKNLIERGTDINMLHQAPLKEAIKHGHIDCVTLFIEKKANLENETGYYSPLEIAAQTGNKEIIALLMQAGVTMSGHPVMGAIRNGHVAVAEWLIQQGARPIGCGCSGECLWRFS